jgi:hypothetical protein
MNRVVLLPILLGLLLLGGLVVWFLSDEKLSPGAKAWLEQPIRAIPVDENLFYSVVGFTASPDEEPSVAGKAMVDEVNKAIDSFVSSSEEDEPNFPGAWNEAPDLDSLRDICSPSDGRCLETYRTQTTELRQLALKYHYLLSRYRGLARYSEYQNTITPSVHSPFPRFASLTHSHRLRNAVLSLDFLEGGRRKPVQALEADMEFLRRLIASANTLLGKLVFASMLSRDIFVYGEWMEHANGELSTFSELRPLDPAAFKFQQPLRFEFLLSADAIDLVKNYPERTGIEGSMKFLSHFGIKRNATINLIYEGLRRELDKLESAPGELAAHVTDDAKDEIPWFDYLYNPVGTILHAISRPTLSRYALRIHDLNGLITLLNAKRSILIVATVSEDVGAFLADRTAEFPDPYTGGPLSWDPDKGLLTFESPASGPKYNRLPMYPRD